MNRREFLRAGAAASAVTAFGGHFAQAAQQKTLRAGLIGCGWYGKSDLFRLIQVAPVEVVSLCDVDKKLLDEAAEMVSTRQASKKKPRTYGDYRAMLKEKDLENHLEAEGETERTEPKKKPEKPAEDPKGRMKDAESRVGPLKLETLQNDNQLMRALEILIGHDVLRQAKN